MQLERREMAVHFTSLELLDRLFEPRMHGLKSMNHRQPQHTIGLSPVALLERFIITGDMDGQPFEPGKSCGRGDGESGA